MQAQITAEPDASAAPEIRKPYRVSEIALMLDVHPATIYRAIEAGHLEALRPGSGRGAIRVLPPALSAYLDSLKTRSVSADELAEVAA